MALSLQWPLGYRRAGKSPPAPSGSAPVLRCVPEQAARSVPERAASSAASLHMWASCWHRYLGRMRALVQSGLQVPERPMEEGSPREPVAAGGSDIAKPGLAQATDMHLLRVELGSEASVAAPSLSRLLVNPPSAGQGPCLCHCRARC